MTLFLANVLLVIVLTTLVHILGLLLGHHWPLIQLGNAIRITTSPAT